jgi:hypothetical protein
MVKYLYQQGRASKMPTAESLKNLQKENQDQRNEQFLQYPNPYTQPQNLHPQERLNVRLKIRTKKLGNTFHLLSGPLSLSERSHFQKSGSPSHSGRG